MRRRRLLQGLVVVTLVALGGAARAQTCDDANECTVNDMCGAGECTGTPQTGGGCDDFDECTVNDRCELDPFIEQVICRGDPAPGGTSCSGGCGTCQAISPEVSTCVGTPENEGAPCDPGLGPCLEGRCGLFPGNITTCLPEIVECPDTDGNPCTDNCSFETGQCEVNAPRCIETCETCDTTTGECRPANEGRACEDFNVCTPASRCEATNLGGGVVRGFCLPGEPIGGDCVGDCNGNGIVVVNELIVGVNIALGSADIGQCAAFDTNSSGGVEVNELIGGVNALLNGCA